VIVLLGVLAVCLVLGARIGYLMYWAATVKASPVVR
jgi:hypothetical protein